MIKFIHTGSAWYAESALKGRDYFDKVMIQLCDDDGNMSDEFSVEFHNLNGPTARICCFDDGIEALIACNQMVLEMGDMTTITPANFIALLKELGYVDATERIADAEDRYKRVRSELRRQINELHEQTNWDEVPGKLMSIGAFRIPNKGIVVAAVNVGSPDPKHDLFRAELLGTSSLAEGDEEADHTDTIDGLMSHDGFLNIALTESFV